VINEGVEKTSKMAAKAEALILIVDVGTSMRDVVEAGGKSSLDKCISAVNMIIQRKIFTDTKKAKDEAALILFGTDGTSNNLNEQAGEGYEHITVAKDLGVMDLELLKFVNNQIAPGNRHGDFLDALVVGLDHLRTKCMGRKMDKKIIIFSDMQSEFTADQLEMIVNGIKESDVNLIFVGPEINDEEGDAGDGRGGGASGRDSQNDESSQSKPLTKQQVQGINCIRHILDEVDGEGMSLSEVLPLLSFFESRRKKQVTTFRGPIEIGESIKINSYAYVKISEEKPASWKKLSALAENAANRDTLNVEMQRSFHANDENQTEVDKENTSQAYRFGKDLVPMTSDEQKTLKLQTTKGCLVLGFTSRKNVERRYFSRNGCHIFSAQPEDEHAAVAFSALCHALEEKNKVAIVRYVSRGNTDPKVGFLAPHIKSNYESLMFIALPYREDIRQYSFPSLEGGKIKQPSTEQIQVVDSLIDSMGLVNTITVDDEEETEELFKPKNILNPITQRQCQCIQSRALNPDEVKIPEVEEYITRSLQTVAEMKTRSEGVINKIMENFPLELVDLKKSKTAANMFGEAADEPVAKKTKGDDETDNFSFASLSRNQITEVGIVDPVNDFKLLIEGADDHKFLQVCNQLGKAVLRLIMDSFLDQYYAKALECLRILREESKKRKLSKEINGTLVEVKEQTNGKRRNDFWEQLSKENICPLSRDEVADSNFTTDDINTFYLKCDEVKEEEEVKADDVDDEDDLLAMM